MRQSSIVMTLAGAAALLAGSTLAQTTSPNPGDPSAPHMPPHMQGSASAEHPMMGMGHQGGMGGMPAMAGCPMMRGMGMGAPGEHIEGKLAFLRTELKITPDQENAWNAFAQAVRTNAQAMQAHHGSKAENRAATAVERLERHQAMMRMQADAGARLIDALKPFYAALSADQQKIADRFIRSPVGLM